MRVWKKRTSGGVDPLHAIWAAIAALYPAIKLFYPDLLQVTHHFVHIYLTAHGLVQ